MSTTKMLVWVRRFIQLILIAIVFFFVADYLRNQLLQIDFATMNINESYLIYSLLLTTFGLVLLPTGCWLIVAGLDQPLPILKTLHIFYVSNLGKYLPGSVWAMPGRAVFYRMANIPTLYSAFAVFWEVILLILASTFIAILSLPLTTTIIPLSGSLIILTLSGVILAILSIAYYQGVLYKYINIFPLPQTFKQKLSDPKIWLPFSSIVGVIFTYAISWVITGTAFGLIVFAFDVTLTFGDFITLIGIYAGSWVIGFIAFFAPAGIGVREAVIIFGLNNFMEAPLPFAIAITSRIIWTVGELIGLIIVVVLNHYLKTVPEDLERTIT